LLPLEIKENNHESSGIPGFIFMKENSHKTKPRGAPICPCVDHMMVFTRLGVRLGPDNSSRLSNLREDPTRSVNLRPTLYHAARTKLCPLGTLVVKTEWAHIHHHRSHSSSRHIQAEVLPLLPFLLYILSLIFTHLQPSLEI
jgi:hypothetical protein